MIISASRRTDIPSFYSEWFFNRLREGFVLVRNPMNPKRVSRVSLLPDVVDGIVFWTKNPYPMISRLDELSDIPYYFQFTLTPYSNDIERGLPQKERVINTFQTLSKEIGKERVVWRYDPILLSPKYTVEFHKASFRYLCEKLASFTDCCVISFLDIYRSIEKALREQNIVSPRNVEIGELAECMVKISKEYGISLFSCSEELALYGILPSACIDKGRLSKIGGISLDIVRDKNQRSSCGCCESVDIGAYGTCQNGCVYCYARGAASYNCGKHDPKSPVLFGELGAEDIVVPRKQNSNRVYEQETLLF